MMNKKQTKKEKLKKRAGKDVAILNLFKKKEISYFERIKTVSRRSEKESLLGKVRKKLARKKVAVILLSLFFIAATSAFLYLKHTYGASFIWTQTNWSGGTTGVTAVHPTDETGWNQYSAKDSGVNDASGELKLNATGSTITHTSDSDFNAGSPTLNNAVVSGNSIKVGPDL